MAVMGMALPQQKDPLDKVLQALQLVQAGLGIKTSYDQVKLNGIKKQKIEDDEKARINGFLTDDEKSSVTEVPFGTQGAQTKMWSEPMFEEIKDPTSGQAKRIQMLDESGKPKREPRPVTFLTNEQLSAANLSSSMAQKMAESKEIEKRQKGIITPSTQKDFIIFSGKEPGSFPMQWEMPDGSLKPVFAKTTGQANFDSTTKKAANQLTNDEFRTLNSITEKLKNDNDKESEPYAKKIQETNELMSLIDDAKNGRNGITPEFVEGRVATLAAGFQKGALTENDFQRGSGAPTSVIGRSKNQIQEWMGTKQGTDKFNVLVEVLKASENALKRNYNNLLIQQQKRLLDKNKKAPEKFKVDWETVKPYEVLENPMQTDTNQQQTNQPTQQQTQSSVDPKREAANRVLNETSSGNRSGVVNSLRKW
jgi:hypothetical protein